MLIEAVEIEGVGPFRERLILGPLDRGLNILAQPNEWGKSTLVKALSRVLFDRYRSESEEIRQLRPSGSSLSPRVDLIFHSKGERFRLVKGFLEHKACELFRWKTDQWERTDESDRADQRLRELLGAPALEGRVAKPETWGFLRYLWARQDEPADWPDWNGASGIAARSKLATVEIDVSVRTLATLLKARAEVLFTPTGKVRAGSPLELAEEECERIRKELAEIQTRRAALEQLQQQHARLGSELPLLERERITKAEEAAQVRAEAEAADKLRAAIGVLEADFARIESQLQQLRRDKEALQGIAESERLAGVERERLIKARDDSSTELPTLEAAFTRAQAYARDRKQARVALEQQIQRHRALLRLRQQRDELARLKAQRERCAAAASEFQKLEETLARIPVIPPAKLKQWREWERTLRDDRVRLEGMGLRVTLKPEANAQVGAECDGTARLLDITKGSGETLGAAQSLVLNLKGWGTVEIASGAAEPAALQAAILEREETLARAFAEARVTSLAEAEAASEQTRALDQQLRIARQSLTGALGEWETAAKLDAAITRIDASVSQQLLHLQPTPDEDAATLISLQTNEQTLAASLKSAVESEEEAVTQIERAREALEVVRRRREEHGAQLGAIEARLRGLQEQREMIVQRYPQEELAAALERVQTEWVRAEARLADARRQMPPNAERLPERSQRLARAAAEIDAACQRAKNDLQRLEIQLEERGAEGLYSRETELDEKLAWACAEAARLREEGYAARLLGELIQQRERTAVRMVLGPLENRLSEVFAGLTGISTRRVWFDETLQVRGIGAKEDELVRFDDLSRGAREQLLLALRAAIALELAADGPQCLVLDDVLVNTDAVRQQNVLDYLQELAGRLQIIVLTCHAERYRGVGHVLTPQGRS
ncbi:AAA family ATPase [Verrucomicrobiota bacterium sgz303538]